MSEIKKVNADQIKSVNISNKMNYLIVGGGDYNNRTKGLTETIKDDSKEILLSCCRDVSATGKNLAQAVEQIDKYINSIADAFKTADKEISKNISEWEFENNNTSTGASTTPLDLNQYLHSF